MRWGFLFHFIAGFFFKQTFRVLLCILNEYCVNEPVAADLNVQRTTCWTRWTPLLVRESLSSLPAATRGWFHYHIQLLLSFKLNNVSPCSAFLRGQVSSRKLNSLLCSSSSPCVSFPFSLSARLSDVRCLLLVSGHRAVWNHRKAAGEWQYDWSFILGEFLIINTPLVHQGSRIDEQRCDSLLLWRFVFSLTIWEFIYGFDPAYVCVFVLWVTFCTNTMTLVSQNRSNDRPSSSEVTLCLC